MPGDEPLCRDEWHRVDEQGNRVTTGLECGRELHHPPPHRVYVDGEPRPALVTW